MYFLSILLAGAMFVTDPVTGQMIQTETGIEQSSDDLFQSEIEEEVTENDALVEDNTAPDDTGMDVEAPEEASQDEESLAGDSDPVVSPSPDLDEEILELMQEQVSLLAESSATVTGSMNSQILDLMERIVNGLPSGYKYVAFRTSSNDQYSASLYMGKKADVSGNTVLFGGDCVRVDFLRYSSSGTSYIYYTIHDAPNSVVNWNNRVLFYTNALEYHPTLGEPSGRGLSVGELLACLFFVAVGFYVLNRRTAS